MLVFSNQQNRLFPVIGHDTKQYTEEENNAQCVVVHPSLHVKQVDKQCHQQRDRSVKTGLEDKRDFVDDDIPRNAPPTAVTNANANTPVRFTWLSKAIIAPVILEEISPTESLKMKSGRFSILSFLWNLNSISRTITVMTITAGVL